MMNERRQTLIKLCFFLVQNSNLVVFIIIITTDYRNVKPEAHVTRQPTFSMSLPG